MSGAGEPHEHRQKKKNEAREEKGIVQAKQRRFVLDERSECALRHRRGKPGGFKLRGKLTQQVEGGKTPSAEMIGKVQLMKRQAPELDNPLEGNAKGPGRRAYNPKFFRRMQQLCRGQAMQGKHTQRGKKGGDKKAQKQEGPNNLIEITRVVENPDPEHHERQAEQIETCDETGIVAFTELVANRNEGHGERNHCDKNQSRESGRISQKQLSLCDENREEALNGKES